MGIKSAFKMWVREHRKRKAANLENELRAIDRRTAEVMANIQFIPRGSGEMARYERILCMLHSQKEETEEALRKLLLDEPRKRDTPQFKGGWKPSA